MKLHLVTVATEPRLYFHVLQQSCARNGIPLTVLGYGQPWTGFSMRYRLLLDFLANLPKDDIVCFIDGYDVVCVRDLSSFAKDFMEIRRRESCKMIVGQEKIFHAWNVIFNRFLFGQCNGVFGLNAGTYVGYVEDIVGILHNISTIFRIQDSSDDQVLLNKYCHRSPEEIYMDHKNELFLTIVMFNGEDVQLDTDLQWTYDNQVMYLEQRPYFVHAPNNGLLDSIIQRLGYTDFDPSEIQSQLFVYRTKQNYKAYVEPILIYTALCLVFLTLFVYLVKKNVYIRNK